MKAERADGLHYDPGARFEVRTRDVEYRHDGSKGWLARVYEPQGAGPFPMLIDIHGGGWCKYDRLEDEPVDADLARHGIFVAALDFRLSNEAPYPASLADINYAIRWFKSRAADFNASAQRVGAIGFSSGGHQAMLTAMRPHDPRYAALPLREAPAVDAAVAYVIVCWPVIDPPALYLQGTADVAVPVHLSQDFVGAYARAGGHVELYMAPDAPHIFLWQQSEGTRRGMALIKSFIQRQLVQASGEAGLPAT